MDLRIIGCHGGETPEHRASAFLVDERLAVDAGSLTRGLDLSSQLSLEACVVSHAHLDHIRDLATLADNRCQVGCKPLVIAATRTTLDALRAHFFNDVLWPDFSILPDPKHPTIQFQELKPGKLSTVAGYKIKPIPVSHTIDTSGFVIKKGSTALGYSGDTGPTDLLWQVLAEEPKLKALLMEVSFPNSEQGLATVSGHHTPRTLSKDLRKFGHPEDLATILFHMKPSFQKDVERECARLRGVNLEIANIDDHYVL